MDGHLLRKALKNASNEGKLRIIADEIEAYNHISAAKELRQIATEIENAGPIGIEGSPIPW